MKAWTIFLELINNGLILDAFGPFSLFGFACAIFIMVVDDAGITRRMKRKTK